MKKFLAIAAAAAFMTAPAFAAKITVSFASDDGTTNVWTFDQETNTATSDSGIETSYTYDAEAGVLCADIPEAGEVCATFAEQAEAVGDSSTYTLSTGGGGTATITAIEE